MQIIVRVQGVSPAAVECRPKVRRLLGLGVAAVLVASPAMASHHLVLPVHAAGGGAYVAVPPVRLFDTRDGTGGVLSRPLGPAETVSVPVGGQGGVPTDATAAVLNVTVTGTTAGSYLTVWPAGVAKPLASNLNWTAGTTIPNLVEVGLGAGGQVSVYNAAGRVDVIFDLAGYVTPSAPAVQGLYNPLVPARILDTRIGAQGVAPGPLGAGASLTLQVTGQGDVPATGVSAVILNVTVTNPSGASYLTIYPADQLRPIVSSLNFVTGDTLANRVIVKLSPLGQLKVFNAAGTVDVVADVNGWFTDSTSITATGSAFVPLTPSRIFDTRDGTGGYPVSPLNAQAVAVQVAGRGGVPAMTDAAPPDAVVANLTITNSTRRSYAALWPDGTPKPLVSDVNWRAGQTIPNLVVVKLGGSGAVDLYNAIGCADVVIDVVGYYTGPPLPASTTSLQSVPDCPWSSRSDAAMAYDAARHEVIRFGGWTADRGVLGDTWTWDGVAWTERHPATSPPARRDAAMAYDAAQQRVILFSGLGNDLLALSDTWSWDGSNWTNVTPPTSPPGGQSPALAYHAGTGKIVLATGDGLSLEPETWLWDGAAWSQAHPITVPPLTYGASMSADSTRGTIVRFGGWAPNTVSQNETWIWDGTNWTHATPALAPPARSSAGMADDASHANVVLFGGDGDNGNLNDTWVWNGTTWSQLHPVTSPLPTADGSMVSDPMAAGVLLYGGNVEEQGGFAGYGGTWIWDGTTWHH